jgi:hypothetical protein
MLKDIAHDLGRYTIELPFGDVYRRPGLDLKSREIATVAAMTALGNAAPQLKVHIHRTLSVGCSRHEVVVWEVPMTRAELLRFMRSHLSAVQATVSPDGSPQAAVVGIAVTDLFEIVFDSLDTTRKAKNLTLNPKIALVIGGWMSGDERTVQYEGVVDRPSGAELEALRAIYYAKFPSGPTRLAWPGLIYLRACPTWIRYANFGKNPVERVELDAEQLKALR